MLVTVILGRWILPKGDITRDQLSQLLLVFLAMGADIVELFDTFKETIVRNNLNLTFVVLGVWTVSLMQFPLILTGGRPAGGLPEHTGKRGGMPKIGTKLSMGTKPDSTSETNRDTQRRSSSETTLGSMTKLDISIVPVPVPKKESEKTFEEKHPMLQVVHLLAEDMGFWSIIASTFLQDGPYLITRLYLLIAYQTNSFTMVFFTCKNILVVILQWYRLMVISCEYRQRVRFAAYFRSYYDAAREETNSNASSSGTSSPTPDTTMSQTAQLLIASPRSLHRKMSSSSLSSEENKMINKRSRRVKAGANMAGLKKSRQSTLEEEQMAVASVYGEADEHTPSSTGIFVTSSESNMSSFKGNFIRQSYSYGSLSATAVPYYFTSMAPLSPTLRSGRLIRQYKSCDDDSGVDVLFQNEPMCHYF